YGRAYEIVYRNVDNQDIFKRLDPKNVFVIYSNDIEVEPVAAVRYRSEKINGKDVTLIDFYTADYRAYFYVDDNRLRERADMPQEV
ncbi:phage portal protein, partial [Staphylococcus pseudintermedius]